VPLERTEAETRSQEGEGGVLEDTATAWQQRRKRTAFGGRWLNVRTCGGFAGSSAQERADAEGGRDVCSFQDAGVCSGLM